MTIQHGQRVYGSVCDSCGEPQPFGKEGAGLERQDCDTYTDHGGCFWLLCDKCRMPIEEGDEE